MYQMEWTILMRSNAKNSKDEARSITIVKSLVILGSRQHSTHDTLYYAYTCAFELLVLCYTVLLYVVIVLTLPERGASYALQRHREIEQVRSCIRHKLMHKLGSLVEGN